MLPGDGQRNRLDSTVATATFDSINTYWFFTNYQRQKLHTELFESFVLLTFQSSNFRKFDIWLTGRTASFH